MPDWPNHGVTSVETFIDGQSTENTYLEAIAATANPVKWVAMTGSISQAASENEFTVTLAYGAGGSEVIIGSQNVNPTVSPVIVPIVIYRDIDLPTGTRIAVKYDDPNGTVTCRLSIAVNVGERAA